MSLKERIVIMQNLKSVDEVITWDDSDDTAIGAIKIVLSSIGQKEKVIFANGGDRNKQNIPELPYFKNNKNVAFKFGVGGNKKLNSSSTILMNFIKSQNQN